MSYRLDLHEFRAWLYCQPADRFLGFSRDKERCPLAAHLSAEMGERVWVDALEWGRVGVQDEMKGLPAWAVLFVEQVDKLHPLPFTARMALRLLGEVDRATDDQGRRQPKRQDQ